LSKVLFDSLFEFLFGFDSHKTQEGASHLAEERLDEIEPRTMLGRKGKLKAVGIRLEPLDGFFGDMGRVIVTDFHYDYWGTQVS
jgi:hypothetical protein